MITAAAERLCHLFVLDGEGVILRPDGVRLRPAHSRRHDGEVQLLGFDLLELDGADLRQDPSERRKILLPSCCAAPPAISRRALAAPKSP
jgi:ATP-dependent DNA ligase